MKNTSRVHQGQAIREVKATSREKTHAKPINQSNRNHWQTVRTIAKAGLAMAGDYSKAGFNDRQAFCRRWWRNILASITQRWRRRTHHKFKLGEYAHRGTGIRLCSRAAFSTSAPRHNQGDIHPTSKLIVTSTPSSAIVRSVLKNLIISSTLTLSQSTMPIAQDGSGG